MDSEAPKYEVLIILRFGTAAHILSVNYDEMARDRSMQAAYKIFSSNRGF